MEKTIGVKLADTLSDHARLHPVTLRSYQNAGPEHALIFSLERGTVETSEQLRILKQKVRTAIIRAGANRIPLLEIRSNQEANGPTNITISGTSPGAKRILADLHDEIQRRKSSKARFPQNTLHRLPPAARRLWRFLKSRTFAGE